MQFSNKHKAMCITFLITGTLVFSMFNIHILILKGNFTEIFYEIEPEEIVSVTQSIEQQKNTNNSETNKAFNQNQKSQRYAQRIRRIAPPEDYVRPDLSNLEYGISSKKNISKKTSSVEKEELNSFSKVNEVLKKQQEEDANNVRSTISYSLVNRKHNYLPTPIYLCQVNGKIVVNISVNTSGKVIDASYNNASNSSNNCLIEHALEYAKKARFNRNTSQELQIGTITFYFEGK